MRYTTRIEVGAWQYVESGAIPAGAKESFDRRKLHVNHVVRPVEQHHRDVWKDIAPIPDDVTEFDYLMWFDGGGMQRCPLGSWIVEMDEAMVTVGDQQFAEDFQLVE